MAAPPRLPWLLVGPLGYALGAVVFQALLEPSAAATDAGKAVAALLGSLAATLSLLGSHRAALPRQTAALVGLGSLAAAVALALLPASAGASAVEPARASLLLVAAALLGAAFADVLAERLAGPGPILTATACLGLFDVWSVWLGPARKAAEGGLLSSLLLAAPVPGGGYLRFVGISDLVAIALLGALARRQGLPAGRAFWAGGAGLALALGQAFLTRRAAPALPWILGIFCVFVWRRLPVRAELPRTLRWLLGTAAALAAATALVLAFGLDAPPISAP